MNYKQSKTCNFSVALLRFHGSGSAGASCAHGAQRVDGRETVYLFNFF